MATGRRCIANGMPVGFCWKFTAMNLFIFCKGMFTPMEIEIGITSKESHFAWKVGTKSTFLSLTLCMIASLKEIWYPCVTDCSHGTIAAAIYFSQLTGCMEFGLVVAIAPCERLTLNPIQPICCDKKSQSQSYNANSPVVGGLLEWP